MDSSAPDTTLSQDIGSYLRYQLRGRRGLIAATTVLAVPALWLGWPWLVAAGLAPLILAVAPCAVMCGLGLCVNRACRKADAGASPGQAASTARRVTGASPISEPETSFGAGCAIDDSAAETKAPPPSAAELEAPTKETVQ